jgi:hypothetical protein
MQMSKQSEDILTQKEPMHLKHLIKEAIEKGVPIEDYIKSLDSSHRYYPIINRKNTYENISNKR